MEKRISTKTLTVGILIKLKSKNADAIKNEYNTAYKTICTHFVFGRGKSLVA